MVDDSDLVIVDQEGNLPFSKGLMAQSLMATGLPPERAYNVAAAVRARSAAHRAAAHHAGRPAGHRSRDAR